MKTKATLVCVLTVLVFSVLLYAQQKPSGVTLRGKIVYSDTGNPVRRAFVSLTRISLVKTETNGVVGTNSHSVDDGDFSTGKVLTGDEGQYEFENVPEGTYYLIVFQDGIYDPDQSDIDNPSFQKIVVAGSGEIDLDLVAQRGGIITGSVRHSDGTPASNIAVSILDSNYIPDNNSDYHEVKTDDRGIYRAAGLRPGSYTVSITEPMITNIKYENSKVRTYFPNTQKLSEAQRFDVYLGRATENVDFVLPEYQFGKIVGTIVTKDNKTPVGRGDLSMFSEPGQDSSSIEVDENGKFEIEEINPGNYWFFYRKGGLTKAIEVDGKNYSVQSLQVDVGAGESKEVVIELPEAGLISGVIKGLSSLDEDKRRRVSRDCLLIFSSADQKEVSGIQFVEKGQLTFSTTKLPPGDYKISTFGNMPYFVERLLVNGRRVESISIESGEEKKDVELWISDKIGRVKLISKKENDMEGYALIPSNGSASYIPFDFDLGFTDRASVGIAARPGSYSLVKFNTTQEIFHLSLFPETMTSELRARAKVILENVLVEEGKITEIRID